MNKEKMKQHLIEIANLLDIDIISGYKDEMQKTKQELQRLHNTEFGDLVEQHKILGEKLIEAENKANELADDVEQLTNANNIYYKQTLDDEIQINELLQTLQEIKEIAEELSCKHPEECFENKPDWNGEVYGCDVADNWKNQSELATCPSKLASAILQLITKSEVGE